MHKIPRASCLMCFNIFVFYGNTRYKIILAFSKDFIRLVRLYFIWFLTILKVHGIRIEWKKASKIESNEVINWFRTTISKIQWELQRAPDTALFIQRLRNIQPEKSISPMLCMRHSPGIGPSPWHNVANINFQLFHVLSNYVPPYRANFLQFRIARHPAVKSIIFTLMRNSQTSVGRWKILRSCLFLPSENEIMRPRSSTIDIGEKQENCSISLSESEPRIIDKFDT